MDISVFIKDDLLKVIVKPNSPNTEVIGFDENRQAVRISVNSVPDKGKANRELLKFLKKQTGRKCSIRSGSKSRMKIISFH